MDDKVKSTYGHKIRVRVCGLCIQNESILLVKHKGLGARNELWSPPGGGVEFMENSREALCREFKEETNLSVEVKELLFVNEFREEPLHAIELFFRVILKNGTLRKGKDPEHDSTFQILDGVRFVTFEELRIMDNEILHNVLHDVKDEESILNMRGYFHFSA